MNRGTVTSDSFEFGNRERTGEGGRSLNVQIVTTVFAGNNRPSVKENLRNRQRYDDRIYVGNIRKPRGTYGKVLAMKIDNDGVAPLTPVYRLIAMAVRSFDTTLGRNQRRANVTKIMKRPLALSRQSSTEITTNIYRSRYSKRAVNTASITVNKPRPWFDKRTW